MKRTGRENQRFSVDFCINFHHNLGELHRITNIGVKYLTNYAVITGDIIRSRQAKDRMELQSDVETKLSFINAEFAPDLAVNFQITLGDEFQGLVRSLAAVPTIASTLREQLNPINVRLSIGIGPIATNMNKIISKMDGPAFHLSRDGISQISRDGERITIYRTSDAETNNILNAVTLLTDILLQKRTDKQWQAIRLYRKERNLKKVADRLNVKFQNIHKRLQAAHWDAWEQAELFVSNYLVSKFSPKKG